MKWQAKNKVCVYKAGMKARKPVSKISQKATISLILLLTQLVIRSVEMLVHCHNPSAVMWWHAALVKQSCSVNSVASHQQGSVLTCWSAGLLRCAGCMFSLCQHFREKAYLNQRSSVWSKGKTDLKLSDRGMDSSFFIQHCWRFFSPPFEPCVIYFFSCKTNCVASNLHEQSQVEHLKQ